MTVSILRLNDLLKPRRSTGPPLLPDEGHEHAPLPRGFGEYVTVAPDDGEHLRADGTDRHDEPAAGSELSFERLRDMRRPRGHDDAIVRGFLGVAQTAVGDDHPYVAVSERLETLAGRFGESGQALDRN